MVTRGPRGTKHLLIGFLLILAGVFFMLGGFGFGEHTGSEKEAREITILNHGGDLEGHTPRGFAGSGAGLFIGDNINENFPSGDGVQMFLSFDIRELKDVKIDNARIYSDAVSLRGDPFATLGNVVVDQVVYESFGSRLWNLELFKGGCVRHKPPEEFFECDIVTNLRDALQEDKDYLQFNLYFNRASDRDGEPDLLLFNRGDTNVNEPGIFELRVNELERYAGSNDDGSEIEIPIILHRVVDSGGFGTERTEENILSLFSEVARIWKQANISFDVTVVDEVLKNDTLEQIEQYVFNGLYPIFSQDPLALHVFFLAEIGGPASPAGRPNGIAYPPTLAVVADTTTVNDYRAVAHEIGHLLTLVHTDESNDRLLFQGANGELLTKAEIQQARGHARSLKAEIERRAEKGI